MCGHTATSATHTAPWQLPYNELLQAVPPLLAHVHHRCTMRGWGWICLLACMAGWWAVWVVQEGGEVEGPQNTSHQRACYFSAVLKPNEARKVVAGSS